MLHLPIIQLLMKCTGARQIKSWHSQFEGRSPRSSMFITNIPNFLLSKFQQEDGIIEAVSSAAYYYRATHDLLQPDVIESMIRYLDSSRVESSNSITDSGCQHTCLNIDEWRLLKKDGRSFSAKGYFGDATNIPTGTCAAVARDIRGKEVLLVMSSSGLVKDRASLIDPYQLMANGCDIEHVVTKRCPSPYLEKNGTVIPLTINKDITLDVSYPTDRQLKSLPRVNITSEEQWSRSSYMASRDRSEPSINSSEVIEDLDNPYDSDADDIVDYINPSAVHVLPPDIWWFLDKNTKRRTENSTTAFVNARKGKDIVIRRKAHKAIASRRIRDKASHDTLFSTIPARGCGSTMLQVFATRKSKFLFGVPMTDKSQVLPATQDFFLEVGIPTALRSDNAQENHSAPMKDLLRKHEVKEEHSEAFLQFQNPVERWIGFIKRSVFKILQHSKAPADEWLECSKYVIACHNKTARKSIHWRTPMEMLVGDTPDVSELVDFAFYQRVFYVADPNAAAFPEPKLHEAHYLGPAYHHGSVLCHWIRLPDGSKIAKSLLRPNLEPDSTEAEEVEELAEKQLYSRGNTSAESSEVEDDVVDQAEGADGEDEGGDDVDEAEPALTSVVNHSVWFKKGRKQVTATAVRDYYQRSKRWITVRMQGTDDEDWSFDKFKIQAAQSRQAQSTRRGHSLLLHLPWQVQGTEGRPKV
jgi:hypothetical protein